MNFDSISLSPLFEKSLIRIIAEFESTKSFNSVGTELTKDLKRKVSKDSPSEYNINLTKEKTGTYRIETPFLLYRDSRLTIISLFKWIERNGSTEKTNNFSVDLKFIDSIKGPFKGTLFNTSTKIENIDKLKFILEFNESKVFDAFPSRKNWYTCQSIQRFNPIQKFIPKENESIDPSLYQIDSGENRGINFETLINGYLRMQYIGGKDYEKKINEVLDILNEFCISSWNCTVNRGFTSENISKFERLIQKTRIIRESYLDYALFKKNFSKINFTVDLLSNPKLLESYYSILRDRIYEIFSNIEFDGEFDLNYDTVFCTFQIRGAKLKIQKIRSVDFVNCEIEFGIIEKSDLYDTNIKDAVLSECNLFRYSQAERCKLINSVVNRTSNIRNSIFDGFNGILNGNMDGGSFINGKIGLFGNASKTTKIVQYQKIKSGFFVAGDQVIIPSKKFRNQ